MISDAVNGGVADSLGRLSRHDGHGVWIREGIFGRFDMNVVNEVIAVDGYFTKLRPSIGEGEVVVDIGAHIGTFATMWHRKNPGSTIACVEVCPENLVALSANVSRIATVIQAACTYDPGELALLNSIKEDGTATGGSVVAAKSVVEECGIQHGEYWKDYRRVAKVTLEDIMKMLNVDRIDVLKLDCEGSEFSILGNTPSLHRIRFICGEYHGRARWDEFRSKRFQGWAYGHMRAGGDLGIFHLENPYFSH